MVTSKLIKDIAKDLGSDLCGVASVDRFNKAPVGFRPNDIFKECQSVIVFAKRVPSSSLNALSCIPYTHTNTLIMQELDLLTLNLSRKLEELGIKCVPIPTDDPYEFWDSERQYGRAILSLRHAGYYAGLGVLGKNTLLINNQFGNMIQLGAVLIDVELESDAIASYEGCIKDCLICINACPKEALDGVSVNQKLCRELSTFKTEKGYILKKCNLCRKVCPNALGFND